VKLEVEAAVGAVALTQGKLSRLPLELITHLLLEREVFQHLLVVIPGSDQQPRYWQREATVLQMITLQVPLVAPQVHTPMYHTGEEMALMV
jgi:hypothetical protein